MSESWYIKYRPKNLEEYIFADEKLKTEVSNWIDSKYIPGNVLFYGPAGQGKTSLAELLIDNIIESEFDIKRIQNRSVTNLDELKTWCEKYPLDSNKKIVYIEEFDKMSPQAIAVLKDVILDNYQSNVSFICTTNYVNKIESGVRQRFSHQFYVNNTNKSAILKRVVNILNAENVQYNITKVESLVNNSIGLSIREIVSKLQVSVDNGKLSEIKLDTYQLIEEEIISLYIKLATNIQQARTNLTDKDILLIKNNPMKSAIVRDAYDRLYSLNIQYSNYINHENIFHVLYERFNYIKLKILCGKYFEIKPIFKEVILISFYYDFVSEVLRIFQFDDL